VQVAAAGMQVPAAARAVSRDPSRSGHGEVLASASRDPRVARPRLTGRHANPPAGRSGESTMAYRPTASTFGTRRWRVMVAAWVAALVVHGPWPRPGSPPADVIRAVPVALSAPAATAAVGPAMHTVSSRAALAAGEPGLVRAARSTERPARAATGDRRETERRARSTTLEAPSGLTVLRYKPDVVLAWTHGGASTTGYELERAMGGGPFRRIGTPGRQARTFRVTGSASGVMSVYRIRAVGAGAVSPYSQEVVVFAEPDRPGSSRHRTGAIRR
jgi:hypothetical protein